MAFNITRKKLIIIAAIVVVLAGGAVVFMLKDGPLAFIFGGSAANTADDTNSNTKKPDVDTGTPDYPQKTAFKAKSKEATELVTEGVKSGSAESLQEAKTIIDAEVVAAEKSGNDGYINDATLARADFLITTGRPQEALDEVLFPLLQKYESDEDYKFNIYAYISWAYRELNDLPKADEYFNQLPEKTGWN